MAVWALFLLLASLQSALGAAWLRHAAPDATLVQVCGPSGMRWVALEDGEPAPAHEQASTGSHCPWCRSGLDAPLGLPPQPLAALPPTPPRTGPLGREPVRRPDDAPWRHPPGHGPPGPSAAPWA